VSPAPEPLGGDCGIAPRRVFFDRRGTPSHRRPDEPTAAHVLDVLHLLPTREEPGSAVPRYFRRSYHPSQAGSPRRAVAHPATPAAAHAAAGAVEHVAPRP
jgi:predicted metal-dependent hydrolase